ncbi:MAG: hypothetical protein GC184_08480 [Rhizobiales bacterium]|nr:hypothetical protein [Hyphomicrobiales bacterium]
MRLAIVMMTAGLFLGLSRPAAADCLDYFDGNTIEMSARVVGATKNGHGSFVLYHLADETPQCDAPLLLTTPIFQAICPVGRRIHFTASVLEKTISGQRHAAARTVTCEPLVSPQP